MPNRTHLVLWWALALSQIVYLLVPAPGSVEAGFPIDTLALALGLAGVIVAVLIRHQLRSRAIAPIQSRALDPRTQDGAQKLFQALILCWALAESVAIYGLLLRLLGGPPQYWAPFVAGGALLLFFGRPWQEGLMPPFDPNQDPGRDPAA